MIELDDYQKKGVRLIARFNGVVLLADDMQVGKTPTFLQYRFNHMEINPAIVVCKSISKYVFKDQAEEHFKMRCVLLEGENAHHIQPDSNNPLYIVNYDILQYWWPYLAELNPQLLAWDECQKAKEPTTNRTQALFSLIFGVDENGKPALKNPPKIPYRIAISGTPLLSRPIELWPTLKMLWPDEFFSYTLYAQRYCKPEYIGGRWLYKGASHLDELHHRLRRLGMIRRLSEQVLNLEKPCTEINPVEIPMKEYLEAETDFINWLKKQIELESQIEVEKVKNAGSKTPTERMKQLRLERVSKAEKLVQIGYLRRLAAKLKLDWCFKWISDWLESHEGKLVLFAWHTAIIHKIHEKYKDSSVVVDGTVSAEKKHLAEKYFKNNKNIRIFIGNLEAAGESISLSTASNHLAFLELGWTPGQMKQAEKRIHGRGQTKQAQFYYIIAKDTIEEDLCKLLQKKQEVISATLDGNKQINTLSIYNELENILKKKGGLLK